MAVVTRNGATYLVVDDEIRAAITALDSDVNRLPYVTDQAQFGMPEYWQRISVERRGDCEDYAMEKQHRLSEELGVPEECRGIATCWITPGDQSSGHAVCLLNVIESDARGCLVLDNISPSPGYWQHKGHAWDHIPAHLRER